MRFWVGPWVWQTSPWPQWRMPTGATSCIDLRSLPQCGTPVTVQGHGVFVTPNAVNLGADYTLLGQAPTAGGVTVNAAGRTSWASRFGLARTPAGPTLDLILAEHLAVLTDPTGADRCPPLVPGAKRNYEILLGGQRIWTKRFNSAAEEAAPLRDLLQRQYRRMRLDSIEGRSHPLHYRKALGYMVRKYGMPYRWFQPGDLPDEPDLPPETTLAENFDTGDSTTLGPTYSWTEYAASGAGDRFSVASNACLVATSSGGDAPTARAESDLSTDDHYAQVNVTSIGASSENKQCGACARFAGAANTNYQARAVRAGLNDFRLEKCVTGTQTGIAGPSAISLTVNFTVKCEANGSTIKGYRAGTEILSVTDTAITGNTRGGLFGFADAGGTSAIMDDWTAADVLTHYTLTADYGSFTLSGQTANLLYGHKITADYGAFTLSGQTAGLLAARKITADTLYLTLTGHVVDLTYDALAAEEEESLVRASGRYAGQWIPYPFKSRKKKKRKNTLAAVLALLLAEED